MKRILLLLVLASFTGLWAMAADITPEQALQQARLFMQKKMQRDGKGLQAPAVAPQMELAGRVNDLYVFNVMKSDGGYVIVSNDDCAVPVLGYSERGSIRVRRITTSVRNMRQERSVLRAVVLRLWHSACITQRCVQVLLPPTQQPISLATLV